MSKAEPSSSKLKRTLSKHVDGAEKSKRKRNKKIKIEKKKYHFDLSTLDDGVSVDLSRFLFTDKRNYLMNFKDNKKVTAKDLSGKVIALIFKSLDDDYLNWKTARMNLLDLHSKLHPAGGFEIVFVAVKLHTMDYYKAIGSTPHKIFLDTVSALPFPAFIMSYKQSWLTGITSVTCGCQINDMPVSLIIDPRGVLTKCHAFPLFVRYGAAGYPFTQERIDFLDSEDDLARNHPPSVEGLLASPERDYLVNSEGEQEPLHNLDNQVVALFFCPSLLYNTLIFRLKEVYQYLRDNMKDFEIVFIYTHGWFGWYKGSDDHPDENSFNKAVKRMPWLALPFKDTDCNKKLQRIFHYTPELLGHKPDPKMVIIGPHGNFIEPMGAQILLSYGVWAYPFSRLSVVNLELERIKDLKLEKLWDLDSVFMNKNGSQVRFSQLVGKRIIVLSTGYWSKCWDRLRKLEEIYIKMKGTSDEFEVIHVHDLGDVPQHAKSLPWLMYYTFDENSCPGRFVGAVPGGSGSYMRLVAFDRDGSLVRRTTIPTFEDNNMVFPFYPGGKNGDMKNEVLLEVEELSEYKLKCFCGPL